MYGIQLQNKPTQLSKLSSVCVGYWDRMWVGPLYVAFFLFSRGVKKLFLFVILQKGLLEA